MPITRQQIRDVLKRATYKPGWTWSLLSCSDEYTTGNCQCGHTGQASSIRVSTQTKNAENSKEPITVSSEYLFVASCEQDVVISLREAIIRLEMHEVSEFLRFDGKHVVDPHPELRVEKPLNERRAALMGQDRHSKKLALMFHEEMDLGEVRDMETGLKLKFKKDFAKLATRGLK